MPAPKPVLDRKVLYPGDVLIREGEPGDCAYFIQSGQVGVYKGMGASETLLTVLSSGAIVGEMALVDNHNRSATVRCLETASMIRVTRVMFERKLEKIDPFLKALLEMFSQKIRRLNDDYSELDKKFQWLLREAGLPPAPATSRWVKAATPAAPGGAARPPVSPAPPVTGSFMPARNTLTGDSVRVAVDEISREGAGRFDRLMMEVALLFHPDCTRERGTETLSRTDVFHEIWMIVRKIDREYGAGPQRAGGSTPGSGASGEAGFWAAPVPPPPDGPSRR